MACQAQEENDSGKFPLSEHEPNCENYKLEPFSLIELDGSFCLAEPGEVAAIVGDAAANYTVSTVMLTRDQFERMPEFEGFKPHSFAAKDV